MTCATVGTDTSERAPIRLVIFDLDDTLCDYAGARAQRLRIAFSTAFEHSTARPPDLDDVIAASLAIHPHGTDHFPELLARFGVHSPKAANAAVEWYRANRFHGLALFPDALETLRLARGIRGDRRIGIVTNGPAEVQRAKIDLLALHAHVDFVIVSGEFGVDKPDPAIFTEALHLGGASASETIVIGDAAEFDIAGAHRSGIRSVWINRTSEPWRNDEFRPDHEVRHLRALHPLLQG